MKLILPANVAMKKKRIEKGWTQKDLAGATNISRQSINAIEMGILNPSYDSMRRICIALDVKTLDELFPIYTDEELEGFANE